MSEQVCWLIFGLAVVLAVIIGTIAGCYVAFRIHVPRTAETAHTIYPARSRLRTLALLAWRLGVTAGMGWLLWRVHR